MKNWIILSPEGQTLSPNGHRLENFQVLGFVEAETGQLAYVRLKENYPYLNRSGFEEIWIYQITKLNAIISYLEPTEDEDQFENPEDRKLVEQIINVLINQGFYDIQFDYRVSESFYFEGYSDTLQEIRVDVSHNILKVYDRYVTNKHFVYFGDFPLGDFKKE